MKKLTSHFSHLLKTSSIRSTMLIVSILIFTSASGFAQNNNWGIGIQLGQPSGLSLKKHKSSGMSTDILLAWDLDDFFFINLHGTWENHISGTNGLHFVYGPGVFTGFRDRRLITEGDDDMFLGISGTFGLAYNINQFEIYIRATPRLAVIESTGGDIGGGLGFRFYFN